jgi:hypothetical protein
MNFEQHFENKIYSVKEKNVFFFFFLMELFNSLGITKFHSFNEEFIKRKEPFNVYDKKTSQSLMSFEVHFSVQNLKKNEPIFITPYRIVKIFRCGRFEYEFLTGKIYLNKKELDLLSFQKFFDNFSMYLTVNQTKNESYTTYPILIDFDTPKFPLLIKFNNSRPLHFNKFDGIDEYSFSLDIDFKIFLCHQLSNISNSKIFYGYSHIINQIRSEQVDFIKAFNISSKFANGIDIVFEEEKIVKPKGILVVKIPIIKCYHSKNDLFMLRSSVLQKEIGIDYISYDDEIAYLIIKNNHPTETFKSDKFLVLNLHPFYNCRLDIFQKIWQEESLGNTRELNGNCYDIPIFYKDKERKFKDFIF